MVGLESEEFALPFPDDDDAGEDDGAALGTADAVRGLVPTSGGWPTENTSDTVSRASISAPPAIPAAHAVAQLCVSFMCDA